MLDPESRHGIVLPGFELPHTVDAAQRGFDDELARTLEAIGDRIEGRPSLARLVYRTLCYGMKYVDKGAALYQPQHRQLQIKQLHKKAISLGYQLIRVPAT